MFDVTKLKLKLFHPCVTGTNLQLKPNSTLFRSQKCNGHVIYKFTIIMGYLKIYSFEIKDLDIIAEDFPDFSILLLIYIQIDYD